MSNMSIVVPVYKVEKYLNRCVDSILAQTYSDFDLILVDDGSPDNCGQICDDYAKEDARIHVIHRENGGLSAARNSGIDWVFDNCFTEWITFIDSDDWVHPRYLDVLLNVNLQNNTEISICGFMSSYDDSEFVKCSGESKVLQPEAFWVENKGNATVAWGKMYKTSLFETIRYPIGKLNEDEYTTFKLLFAQKRISVVSDALYMYYQASSSITRSKWNTKKIDALGGCEEQLLFFEEYGYKAAFCESKRMYVFSIKDCIKEIRKSEDKKKNRRLMKNTIKSFLYRRYHNKVLSTDFFCCIYIRKLIIEQFILIRINVLRNRIRKAK